MLTGAPDAHEVGNGIWIVIGVMLHHEEPTAVGQGQEECSRGR